MRKIGFLLLICSAIFSGCEKDDICDATTITTPRVVIEFYDFNIPANLKSVSNLKVTGLDGDTVLSDSLGVFSGTTISLPLRASQDITKYSLVLNSTVATSANEDFLQFNYTRNNVYVSRACGYKTLFELQGNPIITDISTPENFWIKNLIVITTKINDESETHIKIYF
jgi:hypothetical protein